MDNNFNIPHITIGKGGFSVKKDCPYQKIPYPFIDSPYPQRPIRPPIQSQNPQIPTKPNNLLPKDTFDKIREIGFYIIVLAVTGYAAYRIVLEVLF